MLPSQSRVRNGFKVIMMPSLVLGASEAQAGATKEKNCERIAMGKESRDQSSRAWSYEGG